MSDGEKKPLTAKFYGKKKGEDRDPFTEKNWMQIMEALKDADYQIVDIKNR